MTVGHEKIGERTFSMKKAPASAGAFCDNSDRFAEVALFQLKGNGANHAGRSICDADGVSRAQLCFRWLCRT